MGSRMALLVEKPRDADATPIDPAPAARALPKLMYPFLLPPGERARLLFQYTFRETGLVEFVVPFVGGE